VTLHTVEVGTAGPRIAFLHGLFGQGRNWTQIARALAGPDGETARCLLVDLPDHGRSPWSAAFAYQGYADAVAATLSRWAGSDPVTLVGHSLGGKTAMVTALEHPDTIARLCVVDIAPKSYGNLHRFTGYIDGMRALPLDRVSTRADADAWFARVEPDPGIRAFLLQNLRRRGAGWAWQCNLDLIAADAARGSASVIADFPFAGSVSEHAGGEPAGGEPAGGRAGGEPAAYDGPVVWLVGADSGYVHDDDGPRMRSLFPAVRRVTVNGAGHWVHTDAPGVVVETLHRLIGR
jgi:pimeloyl-ACP methyl ester carboxylesterase